MPMAAFPRRPWPTSLVWFATQPAGTLLRVALVWYVRGKLILIEASFLSKKNWAIMFRVALFRRTPVYYQALLSVSQNLSQCSWPTNWRLLINAPKISCFIVFTVGKNIVCLLNTCLAGRKKKHMFVLHHLKLFPSYLFLFIIFFKNNTTLATWTNNKRITLTSTTIGSVPFWRKKKMKNRLSNYLTGQIYLVFLIDGWLFVSDFIIAGWK